MPRIHDISVRSGRDDHLPGRPPVRDRSGAAGWPTPRSSCRACSLSTHTGTHVDAPSHFVPGGAGVDQLPLEILLGKARVVELPARERVDRADLEAVDLRDDLRVLLKTRMSGQAKPGHHQDHVHLSEDAALYLAQAGTKLVGIDYPVGGPLRHHRVRGPSGAARRCRHRDRGARPLGSRAGRVRHGVPAPACRGR